jgi:hypothetical protein
VHKGSTVSLQLYPTALKMETSMFLQNIGIWPKYYTAQLRRPPSIFKSQLKSQILHMKVSSSQNWEFKDGCLLGSEVLAASIIRAESEMSVNFYHTTWGNNPEDSHLQSFQHSMWF